MTPFVNGTSAMQRLPYNPVSFKRMRCVPGNCRFHVYRDHGSNTLFELRYENAPVMAFLFHQLPMWQMNQRRDAFARLFQPSAPDSTTRYINVLPTITVDLLPSHSMWKSDSTMGMGEDMFWASGSLRLNVHPTGSKDAAIDVLSEDGCLLATFGITGMASDEEELLDTALELRHTLHLEPQIRVESLLGQEKVIWFIPNKLRKTTRYE